MIGNAKKVAVQPKEGILADPFRAIDGLLPGTGEHAEGTQALGHGALRANA